MPSRKHLNLEQIARLAGVSRSTVSRVINNDRYVSIGVRDRVTAVIEREGFQPNATARNLARQQTGTLGVISPEGMGTIFGTPYFPILFEGVFAAANQTDYAVSLWVGSTPAEMERIYRHILGYRLMDGAMLLSAIRDDSLPQRLLERHIPVVLLGQSDLPGILTVDVDNFAAARAATEHLIQLGRRRIAHIGARNTDLVSAERRFCGYRAALELHGLAYDPQLVYNGDYSEATGYRAGVTLAARGIDALFAANDLMAYGVLDAARVLRLKVPEDVSVVGFDDLEGSAESIPSLTTATQPMKQLGHVAASYLMRRLDGRDKSLGLHQKLPVPLGVRGSTAPPAQKFHAADLGVLTLRTKERTRLN